MTDFKTPLDKMLAAADESLCAAPPPVCGSRIRHLARQQTAARVRLSGTAMIAAMLIGAVIWAWSGSVDELPSVGVLEPAQVASDDDRLQAEDELLRQRLRLLAAERRLQRLQYELEMARRFTMSASAVEQTNATAWTLLVQIADWERRAITDAERTQLEQLVRSFPETTAESVARNMLATNEVSNVLLEKRNEL